LGQINVYHYSNCSSCREAITMLRGNEITFVARDLFAQPLSTLEIEALCMNCHITVDELVSTRSRPYRELELAKRSLSGEETIQLMAAYPALIRRPLIVHDGRVVIGLNRSAIESLAHEAGQKDESIGT
jgi:regulatory protein spx